VPPDQNVAQLLVRQRSRIETGQHVGGLFEALDPSHDTTLAYYEHQFVQMSDNRFGYSSPEAPNPLRASLSVVTAPSAGGYLR
jgi:hypothetical protein